MLERRGDPGPNVVSQRVELPLRIGKGIIGQGPSRVPSEKQASLVLDNLVRLEQDIDGYRVKPCPVGQFDDSGAVSGHQMTRENYEVALPPIGVNLVQSLLNRPELASERFLI